MTLVITGVKPKPVHPREMIQAPQQDGEDLAIQLCRLV